MQPAPVSASQAPSPTTEAPCSTPRLRVVLFSLVALAAGIATTVWLERIRYERFPGYLQAKIRTVTAGRDARISRILAEPGSVVTAGQPLIELEDESFGQRLVAQQREVETLEIELARARAKLEVELEVQRRDLRDRIFEAKWRAARLARESATVGTDTSIAAELARNVEGVLPPVVPTTRGPSLIFDETPVLAPKPGEKGSRVVLTELELCQQRIEELEQTSRELPDKISRSMGVDLAQARLEHARGELATLEAQKKSLTLVAERPGMVGVYQKQPGDRVTAWEPIVQVLDEEQPYLLLQIPSPRIADFAPGTEVELRFPGGRKGKGRVEDIPPQASPLSGEGSTTETTITAHVDPVGALWPEIPFGSVVEVRRRR